LKRLAFLLFLVCNAAHAQNTVTVPTVPPNCTGLCALQWNGTSQAWGTAAIPSGGGGGGTTISGGVAVTDVTASPYNAVGDGVTDNTSAFQAALNAAASSNGILYIPPAAGCYLVGAINGTNLAHVTVLGNGAGSCIAVHGSSPTNHIWWDISQSGYADVTFRNLKIVNDASTIPAVLILAGATSGNTISGIFFDHVLIQAKTSQALFYGFNLANSGGNSGFSCRDSTFVQLNNGASNTNPSRRNAAVVLDGINSRGIASDYVTLTSAHAGSDGNTSVNCNYIDFPSGFGNGIQTNNAALVFVTSGQNHFSGGSVQGVDIVPLVIWANSEGLTFNDIVLQAPHGSITATGFVDIGGGLNGVIAFNEVFFSVPKSYFIGLDAPVGGTGGVAFMSVRNPDVGGNPAGLYFILDPGACAGFPPTGYWLLNSNIQFNGGANKIALCGSVDPSTTLQSVGLVALVGGATDYSHHW